MWILITNNNASGSGKVTVKVIIGGLWFVAVIELVEGEEENLKFLDISKLIR